VDARRRLLAPGGILIPQCDVLWAAVVEAPDLYSDGVAPWEHNGFGLDMTAARRIVTNTWRKARVNPEQLLAKPQSWVTLDYSTLEGVHVSHEMTWTALRAGTAHGLSIWFDSTLAQGVHISNAPGEPELCYGNAFFPWLQPVDVRAGDIISVALHANLVGEDYVWRWNTSVFDQHGPQRLKARFNQSTFFAAPLTRAHIAKQAADYVPTLSENGQIDSLILQLMESGTSLGEIAHRVSASFPTHFIDWYDALTRVGEVSQNYSR
jgi:protein arginine N-methyltransferase 1